MFNANTQKGRTMKPFEFSGLPSHASVAAAVTLIVTGWFAMAGGAILADRHSEAMIESARVAEPVAEAIPPEARFTVVVEAKRLRA